MFCFEPFRILLRLPRPFWLHTICLFLVWRACIEEAQTPSTSDCQRRTEHPTLPVRKKKRETGRKTVNKTQSRKCHLPQGPRRSICCVASPPPDSNPASPSCQSGGEIPPPPFSLKSCSLLLVIPISLCAYTFPVCRRSSFTIFVV